jgi:hypothetical protein
MRGFRVSSPIGGDDVNDYLAHHGPDSRAVFAGRSLRWVELAKLATGVVAPDSASADAVGEELFLCPDGQSISLGSDRAHCFEALFDPSILMMSNDLVPGVGQLAARVLRTTPMDMKNVMVTGGNSLATGFIERLKAELPRNMNVRRSAAAPNTSAWVGASILASLSTSRFLFVTREQYDEAGPSCATKFDHDQCIE